MRNGAYLGLLIAALLGAAGCSHGNSGNKGQIQSYPAPSIEAAWIRNGEPILYDKKQWYPKRDIEILLDLEVFQIGEYKGVQIFIEKTDIKPYRRLYTKFAKNKYRYFERRDDD